MFKWDSIVLWYYVLLLSISKKCNEKAQLLIKKYIQKIQFVYKLYINNTLLVFKVEGGTVM